MRKLGRDSEAAIGVLRVPSSLPLSSLLSSLERARTRSNCLELSGTDDGVLGGGATMVRATVGVENTAGGAAGGMCREIELARLAVKSSTADETLLESLVGFSPAPPPMGMPNDENETVCSALSMTFSAACVRSKTCWSTCVSVETGMLDSWFSSATWAFPTTCAVSPSSLSEEIPAASLLKKSDKGGEGGGGAGGGAGGG